MIRARGARVAVSRNQTKLTTLMQVIPSRAGELKVFVSFGPNRLCWDYGIGKRDHELDTSVIISSRACHNFKKRDVIPLLRLSLLNTVVRSNADFTWEIPQRDQVLLNRVGPSADYVTTKEILNTLENHFRQAQGGFHYKEVEELPSRGSGFPLDKGPPIG